MDMMEQLRRALDDSGPNRATREPIGLEDFKDIATFFDNRDFEVGTYVMKRRDSKDTDEGGLCNYRFPLRGEPALVVGHFPGGANGDNGYANEILVILTKYDDGKLVRLTVDPVFFERYEAPGERMLREIAEEEAAAKA